MTRRTTKNKSYTKDCNNIDHNYERGSSDKSKTKSKKELVHIKSIWEAARRQRFSDAISKLQNELPNCKAMSKVDIILKAVEYIRKCKAFHCVTKNHDSVENDTIDLRIATLSECNLQLQTKLDCVRKLFANSGIAFNVDCLLNQEKLSLTECKKLQEAVKEKGVCQNTNKENPQKSLIDCAQDTSCSNIRTINEIKFSSHIADSNSNYYSEDPHLCLKTTDATLPYDGFNTTELVAEKLNSSTQAKVYQVLQPAHLSPAEIIHSVTSDDKNVRKNKSLTVSNENSLTEKALVATNFNTLSADSSTKSSKLNHVSSSNSIAVQFSENKHCESSLSNSVIIVDGNDKLNNVQVLPVNTVPTQVTPSLPGVPIMSTGLPSKILQDGKVFHIATNPKVIIVSTQKVLTTKLSVSKLKPIAPKPCPCKINIVPTRSGISLPISSKKSSGLRLSRKLELDIPPVKKLRLDNLDSDAHSTNVSTNSFHRIDKNTGNDSDNDLQELSASALTGLVQSAHLIDCNEPLDTIMNMQDIPCIIDDNVDANAISVGNPADDRLEEMLLSIQESETENCDFRSDSLLKEHEQQNEVSVLPNHTLMSTISGNETTTCSKTTSEISGLSSDTSLSSSIYSITALCMSSKPNDIFNDKSVSLGTLNNKTTSSTTIFCDSTCRTTASILGSSSCYNLPSVSTYSHTSSKGLEIPSIPHVYCNANSVPLLPHSFYHSSTTLSHLPMPPALPPTTLFSAFPFTPPLTSQMDISPSVTIASSQIPIFPGLRTTAPSESNLLLHPVKNLTFNTSSSNLLSSTLSTTNSNSSTTFSFSLTTVSSVMSPSTTLTSRNVCTVSSSTATPVSSISENAYTSNKISEVQIKEKFKEKESKTLQSSSISINSLIQKSSDELSSKDPVVNSDLPIIHFNNEKDLLLTASCIAPVHNINGLPDVKLLVSKNEKNKISEFDTSKKSAECQTSSFEISDLLKDNCSFEIHDELNTKDSSNIYCDSVSVSSSTNSTSQNLALQKSNLMHTSSENVKACDISGINLKNSLGLVSSTASIAQTSSNDNLQVINTSSVKVGNAASLSHSDYGESAYILKCASAALGKQPSNDNKKHDESSQVGAHKLLPSVLKTCDSLILKHLNNYQKLPTTVNSSGLTAVNTVHPEVTIPECRDASNFTKMNMSGQLDSSRMSKNSASSSGSYNRTSVTSVANNSLKTPFSVFSVVSKPEESVSVKPTLSAVKESHSGDTKKLSKSSIASTHIPPTETNTVLNKQNINTEVSQTVTGTIQLQNSRPADSLKNATNLSMPYSCTSNISSSSSSDNFNQRHLLQHKNLFPHSSSNYSSHHQYYKPHSQHDAVFHNYNTNLSPRAPAKDNADNGSKVADVNIDFRKGSSTFQVAMFTSNSSHRLPMPYVNSDSFESGSSMSHQYKNACSPRSDTKHYYTSNRHTFANNYDPSSVLPSVDSNLFPSGSNQGTYAVQYLDLGENISDVHTNETDSVHSFSVSHLVNQSHEPKKMQGFQKEIVPHQEDKTKDSSRIKNSSKKQDPKSRNASISTNKTHLQVTDNHQRRRSPGRNLNSQSHSGSFMWNNRLSHKQSYNYSAEAILSSQCYGKSHKAAVGQNYPIITGNQMYQSNYPVQHAKNFQSSSFSYGVADRSAQGNCNNDYNFQFPPQPSGSFNYGGNMSYVPHGYHYQNLPTSSSTVFTGDIMAPPGTYRLPEFSQDQVNFPTNPTFPFSLDPQEMCGSTGVIPPTGSIDQRCIQNDSVPNVVPYNRAIHMRSNNPENIVVDGLLNPVTNDGTKRTRCDSISSGILGGSSNFLDSTTLALPFTPPCDDPTFIKHQSNFLLNQESLTSINNLQTGTSNNNNPILNLPESVNQDSGPLHLPSGLRNAMSNLPFSPMKVMDRHTSSMPGMQNSNFSSSSLSNFNLTSIIPEIDGKGDDNSSSIVSAVPRIYSIGPGNTEELSIPFSGSHPKLSLPSGLVPGPEGLKNASVGRILQHPVNLNINTLPATSSFSGNSFSTNSSDQ